MRGCYTQRLRSAEKGAAAETRGQDRRGVSEYENMLGTTSLTGKQVQLSAVQHNMVQHCTVRYSTMRNSTVRYSTIRYSTAQYGTAQYGTAQHSMVQHSTVRYSAVHHNTVQHSTVRYSTAQYSAVQYKQGREQSLDRNHSLEILRRNSSFENITAPVMNGDSPPGMSCLIKSM
jgi:hypothetical protein